MKKITLFLLLSLFSFANAIDADAAEKNASAADETTTPPAVETQSTSRMLPRNAVSLELLGRGILYSLNYDYLIQDNIAIGAGFSNITLSAGTSSASATFIPLYGNYYFTGGNHRWFGTGGMTLIHTTGKIDSESKVSGTGLAAIFGAGYEYRGDSGFLFRINPYLFVGKARGVWLGTSLGYAF